MRKLAIFVLTAVLFGGVQASQYWPFEPAAVDEKPKRVSELVKPASDLIEEASELAAEGKTNESVSKYREALAELNAVEAYVTNHDPNRAKSAEFATLRNKRAYVNAAIDSLLLGQVQSNAKAVAVSDTTELEKRLDRERWGKQMDKAREELDRHESASALSAFEKAKEGTTNAVLIAVTQTAIAGAYCQEGAFEKACRALVRSREELMRAGAISDEERRMASEVFKTLQTGAVIGYRETFALGRRICEDNARLRAMKTMEELTSTNGFALASNVVVRLAGIRDRSGVFAFPVATAVSRVAGGLAGISAKNYDLMISVTNKLDREWPLDAAESNLTWNVEISRLKAALAAYERIAPKIDKVDAGLANILKLVEKEVLSNLPQTSWAEKKAQRAKARSRRDQALAAIETGDWTTARRLIDEMLVEKPNGDAALNLKAAMEAKQGKLDEAEATLDRARQSNPRSYFACYNLARIMLQRNPGDTTAAQKMYETGRTLGGPVDAQLEEAFK